MLSHFPFIFRRTKQICTESNLGGNGIIKQQVCVLVSQVNTYNCYRVLQQEVTSHSVSITYFSWMTKAHSIGWLTPGPNTFVLPRVYRGLPSHMRPHFMAAITFFLVVNNRTCKSTYKILLPTTLPITNWIVSPLLAFQLDSSKTSCCANVPTLHSRVM